MAWVQRLSVMQAQALRRCKVDWELLRWQAGSNPVSLLMPEYILFE